MLAVNVGSRIKLVGTFRNAAGILTTPTNAVCFVGLVGSEPTIYTLGVDTTVITSPSAGVVEVELTVPPPDGCFWAWGMSGTGAVEQAEYSKFEVKRSPFA